MPVTAVLWDIDGTLLSSGGVAAGAFLDAVLDITGRRPEGRGLDLGGRIDPEIAGALLRSVDADEGLVPHVLARLHVNATARVDELREQVRTLPESPRHWRRSRPTASGRRSSPATSRASGG